MADRKIGTQVGLQWNCGSWVGVFCKNVRYVRYGRVGTYDSGFGYLRYHFRSAVLHILRESLKAKHSDNTAIDVLDSIINILRFK